MTTPKIDIEVAGEGMKVNWTNRRKVQRTMKERKMMKMTKMTKVALHIDGNHILLHIRAFL